MEAMGKFRAKPPVCGPGRCEFNSHLDSFIFIQQRYLKTNPDARFLVSMGLQPIGQGF